MNTQLKHDDNTYNYKYTTSMMIVPLTHISNELNTKLNNDNTYTHDIAPASPRVLYCAMMTYNMTYNMYNNCIVAVTS